MELLNERKKGLNRRGEGAGRYNSRNKTKVTYREMNEGTRVVVCKMMMDD
jgi:hypothetical protein